MLKIITKIVLLHSVLVILNNFYGCKGKKIQNKYQLILILVCIQGNTDIAVVQILFIAKVRTFFFFFLNVIFIWF